jgi:hypothetical protein
VLKQMPAEHLVVHLTRLGRRPEQPGGHRPRTRPTVRRCSRNPNRSTAARRSAPQSPARRTG